MSDDELNDIDWGGRLRALPVPPMSIDLTERIVSRWRDAGRPAVVSPTWIACRRVVLAMAACVVLSLGGLVVSAWSGPLPTGGSGYAVHDYWGERLARLMKEPTRLLNWIERGVDAG